MCVCMAFPKSPSEIWGALEAVTPPQIAHSPSSLFQPSHVDREGIESEMTALRLSELSQGWGWGCVLGP